MRPLHWTFSFSLLFLIVATARCSVPFRRKILHQPFFPAISSPPPSPEQQFFPDKTASSPPPAAESNVGVLVPARPIKTVAIGTSVGIVTLGMLSGLAFFLYRHRKRHAGDGDDDSGSFGARPRRFLNVWPSGGRSSGGEGFGDNVGAASPYRKLGEGRAGRYRPSPDLQPLPPLKNPILGISPHCSGEEAASGSYSPTPMPRREKQRFLAPNRGLVRSENNLPPPPPPPPPPALLRTPKQRNPIHREKGVEEIESNVGSSAMAADSEGAKPRLKPLHWDKVRATSDRATVWDQLKSSSFQLNEDMMESLFGCNAMNNPATLREPIGRSVLPPVEKESRVLDPKKSQNIAILLRALNVTQDEVAGALLNGEPESLGVELLESLVKMAPTKEEEIKLRDYNGDVSKLGSAERFLKAVLDIPFAFKRVEAMLYRGNFNSEVKYLRNSFQTLEAASEELKNSRLFLKLLEAVLRTGNRMNVGTNRGDAKSFKLDTLLKLVDIKGADGKTTLLHFVVQEIIRTEGENTDSTNENKIPPKTKEGDFRKQGLEVVAGLGRDLANVKKAAGMDSDVLSSYVSKLETGLVQVRLVLQYEKTESRDKFFDPTKLFLKDAEEEISQIKEYETKALSQVKDVTRYFHGNAAREEPRPFRIFMIVRDFLLVLDNVCKEVGRMQDRTMVGSARSFPIPATASLPVVNRYNVRHNTSSDDESSSP